MNPVLLVALAALAVAAAWFVLRGDWLVKTWRSAVLVTASVAALPILGIFFQPPVLFVLWIAIAALLWTPLILRFGWVMSLGPPDGPLAKQVDALQAAVARASRDFRAGRIDGQTLASRVGSIREQAAGIVSPDPEWRAFLKAWIAELATSEQMARNPGDSSLSIDDARALRAEAHRRFAELVNRRASFWR